MKARHAIPWLLCAILAVLLFHQSFAPVQVRTEYVYDSIPVPGDARLDTVPIVVPMPIPRDIDTSAVLADYFSKKTFSALYADTNIRISLKPTISRNALDSLSLEYQWLRPMSITRIQARNKHALYAGFQAGLNGSFGPELTYLHNDRWKIDLGYNLQPGYEGLMLGVGVRVF
jgi:hypothetical protein